MTLKVAVLGAPNGPMLSLQSVGVPVSPAVWRQRRHDPSPIISYLMDAEEAVHANGTSYVPMPVQIGDDVWIYVKTDGARRIRAWKRTNGVGTPVLQGTVLTPSAGPAWDDEAALECTIFNDGTTLHMLYKGKGFVGVDAEVNGVGYATAPVGTPLAFTKYASNPVLTPAAVESALGLAADSVVDVMIYDVVRDSDGLWHGFGSYGTGDNDYRVIRCTSPDLIAWTVHEVIITAPPDTAGGSPSGLAAAPTVFRHPTAPYWVMIYQEGLANRPVGAEINYLRVALSQDLETWTPTDEWLLMSFYADVRNGHAITDEDEIRTYAARMLKGGPNNATPLLWDGEYQLWYSMSNAAVNDASNVLYLEPHAARDGLRRPILEVYREGAQAIASSSDFDTGWVDVEWNIRVQQVPLNALNFNLAVPGVSPVDSEVEWVCRASGVYRFEVCGSEFAANATGIRALRFLLNSAQVPDIAAVPNMGASIRTPARLSACQYLAEGDVLKVQAWQNSGGALDIAAYFARPRWTITRVE